MKRTFASLHEMYRNQEIDADTFADMANELDLFTRDGIDIIDPDPDPTPTEEVPPMVTFNESEARIIAACLHEVKVNGIDEANKLPMMISDEHDLIRQIEGFAYAKAYKGEEIPESYQRRINQARRNIEIYHAAWTQSRIWLEQHGHTRNQAGYFER